MPLKVLYRLVLQESQSPEEEWQVVEELISMAVIVATPEPTRRRGSFQDLDNLT